MDKVTYDAPLNNELLQMFNTLTSIEADMVLHFVREMKKNREREVVYI